MDPLAIGGLVVGVLGALFGYLQWRHPRHPSGPQASEPLPALAFPGVQDGGPTSLLVKLAFGFLHFGPQLTDQKIIVSVSNPTPRTLRVVHVGLLIGAIKSQLIAPVTPSTPTIPCTLKETETLTAWFDLKETKAALRAAGVVGSVEIRPFALDSYDERHEGKPVLLDVDK